MEEILLEVVKYLGLIYNHVRVPSIGFETKLKQPNKKHTLHFGASMKDFQGTARSRDWHHT